MQRPVQLADAALRPLRAIHLALLASMLLYVYLGEKLFSRQPNSTDRTFVTAVAVISAAMIGIAFIVRAKMIRPALDRLQSVPDDANSLRRLRSGSIVSYILAESVVMFGLILRALSGTLHQSLPFYIAGPVLMVLWWPRRD